MASLSPSVVLQFIASEQERLLASIKPAVEQFWDEHRERGMADAARRGRYGVSLRPRAAGVSIQWFEIRYITRAGQKQRRPFHIRLPKQRYRYRETDFPRAHDWEVAHIERIEQLAEPIRRLTPMLGNLQRGFKAYAAAAGLDLTFAPEIAEESVEVQNDLDLGKDLALPRDLSDLIE
ncbi:hypothetical protein FZ983_27620 [Azospirillum sp. B21]|uniref:conjugative transfer protein MobI(A/C) n=1 Tax=Azospirillum sp. B21 TaxID=2607496 RepID=UPI0011ECC234|nr:conjugative transfer protein MobI(A/C) [Azospirillum sp. B21]KAA0574671.1 hypothetical protein FZ983_27620 [Azospirillum sp. B21]